MIVKELFIPKKRIVYKDKKELDWYIDLYNGKKNIYTSVYDYNNFPNAQNAIVDKIFLDFDYDDKLNFFKDTQSVSKYLTKKNINHRIHFSGRGFHIYINTQKESLLNPKKAIKNFVNTLHKKTNTKSDSAVIGDLRRVSRLLYTKNLKTGLYCIPISYEELLNLSYSEIKDLAKTSQKRNVSFESGELISLIDYDAEPSSVFCSQKINIEDINLSNEFPPCMQIFMKDKNLGYKERGQVILYLRDSGYTEEETIEILRSFLSDKKFYHSVYEEHQVRYLFAREDILFNSCNTMKQEELCASSICDGNNLYL